MLSTVELYYFSPTGRTKKAGEIFCEGIAENVKTVNLGIKDKEPGKPEGELVVAAAPVFGGRIPAIATEKLKSIG